MLTRRRWRRSCFAALRSKPAKLQQSLMHRLHASALQICRGSACPHQTGSRRCALGRSQHCPARRRHPARNVRQWGGYAPACGMHITLRFHFEAKTEKRALVMKVILRGTHIAACPAAKAMLLVGNTCLKQPSVSMYATLPAPEREAEACRSRGRTAAGAGRA